MRNTTKTIELPEDLQAFAEERVGAGEYASVSDVVRDAFTALQERLENEQWKIEELRREAKKGFDQLDAGQGVALSGDELLARSDRRLGLK